jgi:multidrug efflux pump subunit AcrB
VIAALLPLAFVTGLMGPYMSPIPINASMGMLISLAVAFVLTPWASYLALRHVKPHHAETTPLEQTRWFALFHANLGPFLNADKGRRRRGILFVVILALIVASVSLVGVKWVVLKMLPFDNKSEFQVVVDMHGDQPGADGAGARRSGGLHRPGP